MSVYRQKKLLVAAAFISFLSSTPASANLIINGSFETGDLTGWTSTSTYGLNPFGTAYGSGMDGTYWHWLGGFEESISTSQLVSGLIAGQSYELTFLMAGEVDADQLRVSIDGGPGTIFTSPGITSALWDTWGLRTLTFTATGTSALISFDSIGLNPEGYDVGLDAVSLEAVDGAVPEPSTWATMLLGFGAIGFGARRARKRLSVARVA